MTITTTLVTLLCFCLYNYTNSAPASLLNEKQREYDLQFHLNNGHMLNEKVKIDLEAGTEYFRVPKHGHKAEIEVMKDFSKKLTIIHEKSENVCYISKLVSETSPNEMKTIIESTNLENTNLELKETTSWTVGKLFIQRSVLSEEMAVMCARSPIYWIQKMKGTGSRQSRDTDHSRVRRSVCATNRVCWFEEFHYIVIRNGRRVLTKIKKKVCRILRSC